MLAHYLVLGLPLDASGEEIRRRYLQRVKEHPPGKDPEAFERVTRAFEALKDERTRIRTAVLGSPDVKDFETALMELVKARSETGRSPGLRELLIAEGLVDARG